MPTDIWKVGRAQKEPMMADEDELKKKKAMTKLMIEEEKQKMKKDATRSDPERRSRRHLAAAQTEAKMKKKKEEVVLTAQPDDSAGMSSSEDREGGDPPSPKAELPGFLPKLSEADEKRAQQHPQPPPPPPSPPLWIKGTRQNRSMMVEYEIPDDMKAALERYSEQVKESGGYDVDDLPAMRLPFGMRNMIKPVSVGFLYFYDDSAELAIKHANKRKKYGRLSLVRIVKVNKLFNGSSLIFMTLEAHDSADGKRKVYQAKIEKVPVSEPRVLEFKLKRMSSKKERKGAGFCGAAGGSGTMGQREELRRSTRCTRDKWLQERYHEQYL